MKKIYMSIFLLFSINLCAEVKPSLKKEIVDWNMSKKEYKSYNQSQIASDVSKKFKKIFTSNPNYNKKSSITSSGNKIISKIVIDNKSYAEITKLVMQQKKLKDNTHVREEFIKLLSNGMKMDFCTRGIMYAALEKNVIFNFKYVDEKGKDITAFPISIKDCKTLKYF
jgi:hypothetical protein